MLAHAITVRDPFNPGISREFQEITDPSPISALALQGNKPFIILRNGEAVLRDDWHLDIADGDILHVMILPQNLDGGGSNPMQVVMMIALTVAAPGLGNLAVGAAWGAAATTASSIAAATIMVGGSMLVNALIPPPSPPSNLQQAKLATPSPTYNLQAQGNLARLDQAIPVQYGRLRFFPDLAALPYVEYAGNEQFVFQLMCLGQGEFDIEAVQIEDTEVSNFEEITYEVIDPGGSLTLFPANVITSGEVSGQELLDGDYVGPFVANSAGTLANHIGIDVVMPRGLYHYTTTVESASLTVQIEAREIDDDGAPVGAGTWTTLGTETFTYNTTTPQRASLRYVVAAGRYEVRMTRTDTKETDTSYGHEVIWAGLRSYLPETRDYGNVTLLAMRMRASNNLSAQASRKVNVIATRMLPIWNGSTWSSNTATSSIAWAFADAYRNTTYGGQLDDSKGDLAALLALDAIWTARGDEFNGRFDNAITLWEALTKIARTGRAKPFMQGGIVRIARDGEQTIPVAMFGMRNIKRGSFSVHYLMPTEETADCIETSYFDRDFWAPRRVQSKLPGSAAAKPAKVESFGITGREQNFKEGMYQAACNRYRRKLISFETEMEGFIPSFGDLIAVSHDMPQWGQHGEVVAYDSDNFILTLSEPMVFTAGAHYVGLRKRDGSLSGPYAATAGTTSYHLVLAEEPDFTPYTGMNEERTHISFGPGEAWRQPAKVISAKPRGLYSVAIECVNEDVSVHTAETGEVAPPVQYSQLPTNYTAPVVKNLHLKSSASDANKVLMVWTPAPGAKSYDIEMAAGTDPYAADLVWTRVTDTTANNMAVTALYGAQTLIRVRGVGLVAGPWSALFYGSESDFMWADDAADMWDADDSTLMWSA